MSPTLVTTVVLLAVIYGLVWHNQPARERGGLENDQQPESRVRRRSAKPLTTAHPPVSKALLSKSDPEMAASSKAFVSNQHEGGVSLRKGILPVLLSFSVFPAAGQNFDSSSVPLTTKTTSDRLESIEHPALLCSNWQMGFTFGAGFGINGLGSSQAHDLAVGALRIGKLLNRDESTPAPVLHHLELAGELWAGAQYRPEAAYLVGLTPMLRYRLMPDSQWTPFLDAGAGFTATDIGHPDLSTIFEFNLQGGVGLEWRWRQNTAVVFQARYMHLSNAGIDSPNHGVNSLLFSGGLTWFF